MADPYQEAVQRIYGKGTVAASRFTKTPILITSDNGNQLTGGDYTGGKNPLINVKLGEIPDYETIQNALHHEDIHALLDKNKLLNPDYDAGSLIDKVKNLFLMNSLRSAYQGFQNSNRAGDIYKELPAYMGAYNYGEIPGTTQSTADDFVTAFKRVIPQPVATNYQRIVDSVKASRK